MPKVKRQRVSEVQEKARKARAYSGQKLKGAGMYGGPEAEYVLQETAMNLSRGKAKGIAGKLKRGFYDMPTKAESKAALLMQNQRAAETERSAARAAAVTKRAKAKAEKAKTTRALTGQASKPSRKVTKRSTDLAKKSKRK
jgi:hypothetical protein